MKYKFVTVFVAGIVLSMPPIAERISLAVEGQPAAPEGQASITSVNEGAGPLDGVAERKARYNAVKEQKREAIMAKLTEARTAALEQKCTAAQNVLTAVSDRANQGYERHAAAVDNISTRLTKLVARLEQNHPDVDTTKLLAALESFQTSSQSYLSDFEVYAGAASEAAQLENCGEDVEEFHLALETAKELRTNLRESHLQLKQELIDSLKTAISEIRAELPAETDAVEEPADEGEQTNDTDSANPDQPVSSEEN